MPHRSSHEININTAKDVFLEKVVNGNIDNEHLKNENLMKLKLLWSL